MAVKITRLGPGTLTIDPGGTLPTEFASQCRGVQLVPSVNRSDPRKVLSGETVPGKRTETWTLEGTLLPDFGEADSIQEFCFINRGKQFSFEFVPNNTKASKLTGTLTVEATSIGGEEVDDEETEIEFEFEVLDPVLAVHTPV